MLRGIKRIPLRIVVTGTRGKSSLTRLLHAGFSACGLSTYARITGVLPREISPGGERTIRRTSPADVREMSWWLSQISDDADAVVLENSAVSPSLQHVASDLLSPTLLVWTTLRADHTEVWGPGREGAAKALFKGIPRRVPVAAGRELLRPPLPQLFSANDNVLHVPETADDIGHDEANRALAALACSLCGIDSGRADLSMNKLPSDLADFRVLRDGPDERDELAVAFSANDPESTGLLFEETGWQPEETILLYHHRPDREARLKNFRTWIEERPWKETVFTRQRRPLFPNGAVLWNDRITDPPSFAAWRRGLGRIFACGNVAGWPLKFLLEQKERNEQKRTGE